VQGDFGESLRWRQPALGLVLERLPATLELAAVAIIITIVLAVPLGILSAIWRDSLFDHVSLVLALVGQSLPAFWLGAMLILLFSVRWPLFPFTGRGTVAHLILPGFTLAAFSIALAARLLRASLLDVLNADYIRTAHGKGLRPVAVLVRHALKNAAMPVVTVIGVQVGTLLGGIVVVEYVFGYPGMGRLLFQA